MTELQQLDFDIIGEDGLSGPISKFNYCPRSRQIGILDTVVGKYRNFICSE